MRSGTAIFRTIGAAPYKAVCFRTLSRSEVRIKNARCQKSGILRGFSAGLHNLPLLWPGPSLRRVASCLQLFAAEHIRHSSDAGSHRIARGRFADVRQATRKKQARQLHSVMNSTI